MTMFPAIFALLAINSFFLQPVAADTDCAGCHTEQAAEWQKSDHARAMGLPNPDNIAASFKGETIDYQGLTARFFTQGESFFVELSEAGKTGRYPVRYTFGFYPLQQYLIALEQDRLQVVPFAWDSRTSELGGQRWFHLEEARSESRFARLHWQQPLQNWNGMCADCHSSGLVRNYDISQDRFSTQFSEMNVGCLSCHDVSPEHVSQSKTSVETQLQGNWERSPADPVAHWTGRSRDQLVMDTCYACHSLRAPITSQFVPGEPFLDHFMPEWVRQPFYQGDGQIAEEVYVYGSFQQSKMHAAGVSCLDCHDAHSNKLKISGNGLCLQCHDSQRYNQKQHHQHDQASTAAQCVTCHMPGKTYMDVDFRRDHRFSKPDPQEHELTGSTDLCLDCHEDRWQKWRSNRASTKTKMVVTSSSRSSHMMMHALRSGQQVDPLLGFKLSQDADLNSIQRATALRLVSPQIVSSRPDLLAQALNSDSDLVRLAAVQQAAFLPEYLKPKLLAPLLQDSRRAVRVTAVTSLGPAIGGLRGDSSVDLAMEEQTVSLEQVAWRGEGRLQLGIQALQMGDTSEAVNQLLEAQRIDPYFFGSYLNLADIYRSLGNEGKVIDVLDQGIGRISDAAPLHYSKALSLIRRKGYQEALSSLKTASELERENTDYFVARLLVLQKVGQVPQALKLIESAPATVQQDLRVAQLARSLVEQSK
ncbi:MAG: hypothetical protein HOJ61_08110 [Gammaproteobacteria bacterium]|nr:hypothetical protein [Gammaproteobacteria bacterium]MBT5602187.1 hypothetical protein [Gammaproteobacteria bacterium]MBT6246150.1 hypothetical protein [Gammaproteobacteria bacterium]